MFPAIETRNWQSVLNEVQASYCVLFPQGDPAFMPEAFRSVADCFAGKYANYSPIDTGYHDFEHTMQGTLCMARLLKARQIAGAQPPMTQRFFELGIQAILLHDSGYLKTRGDTEGTGAKYTLIHVDRSAEFAWLFLSRKKFPRQEIAAVQHMIYCTGVNVDVSAVPFQSEIERITGFALGTADLLGQMAADDYVEKLPILYSEFEESARFHGNKRSQVGSFASAEDLMRRTPAFWEKYVRPKLENSFQGIYRFLNDPYPGGENWYIKKIEANIAVLRGKLALKAG